MKKILTLTIISLLLISTFSIIEPQVKAEESNSLEVVCVPWRGDENLPHPTYEGKEITLKGTVRYEGQISWEWNFGDGSIQTGTAITTDDYPCPISAKHTYTGAVGTMYVAKLTVMAGGETKSDTYLVRIEEKTRKVEADVAVDEGLWWLYQQQNRYSSGGVDYGYWYTTYRVAHTGAAVQAFENNLHKPYGEPSKDPYVDAVRRGLNYITSKMSKVSIPAGDGDTNGNGFGIACYDNYGVEMYEIGIAMMAIISSDTPGRVTVAGPDGVIGRTYREIVQDMADFCAYAQNGPETGFYEGGWRYYRNYGMSDNSVTQWPIIGMEPAETKWNITIADFVKPRLEGWLNRTQCKIADWRYGGFGYTSATEWVNIAKTAGTGIPGFLFCGVPETDQRVVDAINFIDKNWATDNFGNGYAMYAVMKAFEEFLHRESTGNHIWWDEYVDYLIPLQRIDGHWDTMAWSASPQLTTAWMIMILTKVVYDIPPTAIAKVNGFDEVEVDINQTVYFDGSQSIEGTYKIVKYEWDWESDGVYDAEGITVSHSFAEYGTYTVTLRVTDNRDVVTGGKKPAMTDTDTCIVHVHPPPHPPIADANGPYIGWIGVPVTLNGSGSWDPNEPPYGNDEIISWNWDLDNDGEFDDAFGEIIEFTWDKPGTYPIALWVRAKEEPYNCEEPSRTIVKIGNHDPVANANGPYETWPCNTIILDGSGSYDPDEPVGDRIVSYEWDLDNDGEYDDAFVVNPEFHMDAEGVYTVRLRVTDTFGATDTDWTIITVKKGPPFILIPSEEDTWPRHDFLNPKEFLGATKELLKKFEVSHILALNVKDPVDEAKPFQERIDAINAQGGMAVIAHPNFNGINELRYTGYIGLEIYNAKFWLAPLATDIWDNVLLAGNRVWGFATDDSHNEDDLGKAWIMVQVPILTKNNILESLKKGNFYATTGAVIESISVSDNTISIKFSEEMDVTIYRYYYRYGWTRREITGRSGKEISYTLEYRPYYPDNSGYVRIEVYSKNNKARAWIQPFFIDALANILYNPYGQAGVWFKGQLHCHTTGSDIDKEAVLPPEKVISWYQNHGYNFLAITDHNRITEVTLRNSEVIDTNLKFVTKLEIECGPSWRNAKIKVVDLKGGPVKGVKVSGWWELDGEIKKEEPELTDINGEVVFHQIGPLLPFKTYTFKFVLKEVTKDGWRWEGGDTWKSVTYRWDGRSEDVKKATAMLSEFIQLLPSEAFHASVDISEQRKNALYEKLIKNEEGDAVAQLIEAGEYQEAIDKLQHDIRPKMDGNTTAEDWIIDPKVQQELCAMIDSLIACLTVLL